MKTKLLLLSIFATIAFSSCTKENDSPVVGKETKELNIQFKVMETRAISDPIIEGTAPIMENVTLFFFKADNSAASPASRKLTAEELATVKKGTNSIKISITSDVTQVSMQANVAEPTNNIYSYQDLTTVDAFQKTIPLTSPKATIAGNAVTLAPKPDLARIEVLGSITPKAGYEYVKVEAVYINNYYTTVGSALSLTASDGDWIWTADALKDTKGKMMTIVPTEGIGTGKAAAHQVIPTDGTQANTPHVVLKISYKTKATVQGGAKDATRYMTITKYGAKIGTFVQTPAYLAFQAGKIYKMELSSLNDYFTTDTGTDTGTPTNPTDEKPEMPKTDLTITVTPVAWTAINIVPGI